MGRNGELATPDPATSRRMKRVRRSDTDAELAIRRALHSQGLRFRVNLRVASQPQVTPDIVFTKQRIAVFVDGCFWHSCQVHGSIPRNNHAWWAKKLRDVVERDHKQTVRLLVEGWTVVRIWEHEDATDVASRIRRVVDALAS